MYLGDLRQKQKRRSSPVRVAVLLLLIGFSLYLYGMARREEIEPPFVPTPTPTRSALSYASEADELYRQGQIVNAIAVYQQAISLDPNDAQFIIPLVHLLTIEHRLDEALELGQKAVDMVPRNARAWTALCMVYDWGGDPDRAVEAGQRAVELDPNYAEAYAYLAEAYVDAMRWNEAMEAIQTALELDEGSADVYRNYGYVLEVQGNWSAAIDAYQKALERHPRLAYIHLAIGRNYLALGDYQAALEHYLKATEIAPEDALANDLAGWAYFGLGEHALAQTYIQKATELDPQYGRAFGHLAITYWTRRNYEEAIPNFERAIELELAAARRAASGFYVTIEAPDSALSQPSGEIVLRGDLVATSPSRDVLAGTLAPASEITGTAAATGTITFDARTGAYVVDLQGVPLLSDGRVYVGWIDGLLRLSGEPARTDPLRARFDGSAQSEGELKYVSAVPIDYYYTLGLAYYYLGQCEKSYPLYDLAMQIDPEDPNAIEGIRLCQISQP
ncbi:MAG: tetratricopeptide repeat protein [Anaerolineales bacterium]|nr:tetratricopeptide repeat protein [Anaerolineales bacterium]